MKKIVIALIIMIPLYVGIGPFLTLNGIKNSIEDNNSESLGDYVDFPVLRQNIKDQINAKMANEVVDEPDNVFMVAAAGLASMFADKLLDAYVTPSGIANLLSGRAEKSTESNEINPDLLENASFSFNTISRFSVKIQGENNVEIKATLRRYGLEWKLTNIQLPEE